MILSVHNKSLVYSLSRPSSFIVGSAREYYAERLGAEAPVYLVAIMKYLVTD